MKETAFHEEPLRLGAGLPLGLFLLGKGVTFDNAFFNLIPLSNVGKQMGTIKWTNFNISSEFTAAHGAESFFYFELMGGLRHHGCQRLHQTPI